MKTLKHLTSSLFFSSGILLIALSLWPATGWGQTYATQVLINKNGSATTLTNSSASSSGNATVSTYATNGASGLNTNNGSWTAALQWSLAGSNTWSGSFTNTNSNTTGPVQTNWTIGTPVPEISPYTTDAELGTPTNGLSYERALVGIPFLHIYLCDDYLTNTTNCYSGADRYGTNASALITESWGTGSTNAYATIIANGYSGVGTAVGTMTALTGAVSSPYYDLRTLFPAPTNTQSITIKVNPNIVNINYSFPFPNTTYPLTQNKQGGSQITVYAFPQPAISVPMTWTPSFAPAGNGGTNGAYFVWNGETNTITVNNLYPANRTYLYITTPGNSYYMYGTNTFTNSDTALTNTSTTVYSSNSLSTNAPITTTNAVTSTSSDPETITFTLALSDLAKAFTNNPPAGTYGISVRTYSPNSPPSGGVGTYIFSGLSSNTWTYSPLHHVNSSITTSPQ